MSPEDFRLETTAVAWWQGGNSGETPWRLIVGWCFGAANATDLEDWWTLYDLADARCPEDWEAAA